MFRWFIRTIIKVVYRAVSEENDSLVSEKKLKLAQAANEWARKRLAPRCERDEGHETPAYYYCSECPISYSHSGREGLPSREISKELCRKRRSYPK